MLSKWWNQGNVTLDMRWTLLNWLLDVSSKDAMNLDICCLPAASFILDAVMKASLERQRHDVAMDKKRLQILGLCSLWIAAKLYNRHSPSVHDFVYYGNYQYTSGQIIETEFEILQTIDFQMHDTSNLGGVDVKTPWMRYVVDLCVLDEGLYGISLRDSLQAMYHLLKINGHDIDEVAVTDTAKVTDTTNVADTKKVADTTKVADVTNVANPTKVTDKTLVTRQLKDALARENVRCQTMMTALRRKYDIVIPDLLQRLSVIVAVGEEDGRKRRRTSNESGLKEKTGRTIMTRSKSKHLTVPRTSWLQIKDSPDCKRLRSSKEDDQVPTLSSISSSSIPTRQIAQISNIASLDPPSQIGTVHIIEKPIPIPPNLAYQEPIREKEKGRQKCQRITKQGKACQRWAMRNTSFCNWHSTFRKSGVKNVEARSEHK